MKSNEMLKTIIHTFKDTFGLVTVIDQRDIRTLWFDEAHPQSRMLISSPNQLIVPYERVMACWQLFCTVDNGHVLQLGLGGASTTKYCFASKPDWQVSVVEIREGLVKLAHEYFALPKDPRLTIYIDDAMQFVAQQAKNGVDTYQLLIVDLFDMTQATTYAYSEGFLQHCLQLLAVDGVMVLNLWCSDEVAFKAVVASIGQIFAWRVLLYPIEDSDNVVVFVFHPEAKRYGIEQLQKRSQVLSDVDDIDFNQHLQTILQHNRQHLHLVMDDA